MSGRFLAAILTQCRLVREWDASEHAYVAMVTAKVKQSDHFWATQPITQLVLVFPEATWAWEDVRVGGVPHAGGSVEGIVLGDPVIIPLRIQA